MHCGDHATGRAQATLQTARGKGPSLGAVRTLFNSDSEDDVIPDAAVLPCTHPDRRGRSCPLRLELLVPRSMRGC